MLGRHDYSLLPSGNGNVHLFPRKTGAASRDQMIVLEVRQRKEVWHARAEAPGSSAGARFSRAA